MRVCKGDFCLKRFGFSLFQPVGSILPRVVLHLGNGKREPARSRLDLLPSIYFRVVTCLTCLPRVADSHLLCSWSLLLCAYAARGVKFGHAFPLKILNSQTRPGLDISLVACLSPGADEAWTLPSPGGLLLLKGGVLLFFDSGNVF